MECRDCEHWYRPKSLAPVGFGAYWAVVPHIVDFTDVKATVRRINKPGQPIDCEPVEFVTRADFSCSNFEPRTKEVSKC